MSSLIKRNLKKNMFFLSINLYLKQTYYKYFVSDISIIKKKFKKVFNREIDLDNPKTFNEKLQWLKLQDRNPLYTDLVDKYEVREYLSKKIGDKYLIPLIGVWDKFEEIDFSKLPNQFVLKVTHDSGGIVICNDKKNFDLKEAKRKIKISLKRNFYYFSQEWPYKNIKPRIICEKYMEDDSKGELKDYKFLCFNGEVKCSFVCLNRNLSSGLNVDFYDIDWNPLPFERHYPRSKTKIPKPINYEKMLEISKKLSKDLPFVRVDFYEVNNKLYIGELTFYPGGGLEEFTPEKYDELLGNWLKLEGVNE